NCRKSRLHHHLGGSAPTQRLNLTRIVIDGPLCESYGSWRGGGVNDGVSGVKFVCPLFRPVLGAALADFAMFAISAMPSTPAEAQGGPPVSLIRDTEIERVLRVYLDPILLSAGLQPEAVHLYIVNDQSVNAFVAEGQNMFIHTGLL